jgi:hypothetical protein
MSASLLIFCEEAASGALLASMVRIDFPLRFIGCLVVIAYANSQLGYVLGTCLR